MHEEPPSCIADVLKFAHYQTSLDPDPFTQHIYSPSSIATCKFEKDALFHDKFSKLCICALITRLGPFQRA